MSSDARDAYIAGLSGSTTYTPPSTSDGTNAAGAFQAGVNTSQSNVPSAFQDTVTTNDQGNFEREKNPLQQQLENLQNQDQALDLINTINEMDTGGTGGMGILNPNLLGYIKDPLVGLGAFTTDMDEQRNVYQLLINKMFQGDNDRMRGALPLNQGDFAGLRRTGPTSFVDPSKSQGFLGDLFSLYTGENKAAVNASDFPGGGIAELPNFGQAGLDFTKEQGFKDYGRIIEELITAATPLKYGKMLAGKTMGGLGDLYNSLYPNRRDDDEDELDKLIDSIDEKADGELAKEILFGLDEKNKNKNKREFFFF
jgi:hypothetical protein